MDMIDFLYKRCPPDWSTNTKWQWHGQSLSQLQSSAERFVPILDYEHFSQFPYRLEILPKEKFLRIKNTFAESPASSALARHMARRLPMSAKEQ